MRRVVVNENLDEMEVHPPDSYRRLVEACVASAGKLLDRREQFVETACPACGSPDVEQAFEKYGYTYWDCRGCATLFISPRPSAAMLDWYLMDSPAAKFRYGADYQEAMGRHTEELAIHRADWVSELCRLLDADGRSPVVDVETRSSVYLEQLLDRSGGPVVAVRPRCALPDVLEELAGSLTAVDSLAALGPANARLIALFDVLEHQISPFDLVSAAYDALGPGGLLIVIARSSSGLDIQVLWEQCATIFPLEHVNLVSVEGMRSLLARVGFEVVELSTPGQLDVQMIERAVRERPDVGLPRFLRYFFAHRDVYARRSLQQFLQENLLSSHLRVVAKKK